MSHICTTRDAFTDYAKLSNVTVQGVGKGQAEVEGRGTVIVNFSVEGKIIRHQLRDVLHIPDAPNCLLSISRLDDSGGHVDFRKGGCRLFDAKNQVIGEERKVNRLDQLYARAELPGRERANLAAPRAPTWDQWHRRFGHISISGLERLKREELVDGLTVDETSIASPTCESCIQAKQAHRPFPKEAEHRSEIAGERIVGDVWGPARVQSIGGWTYYVSFLDDAKRLSTVLFLKRKSDAYQRIREYGAVVKRKFRKPPKYMRFDNGAELVNSETRNWASEKGIIIETTAPYSPSQNGIAEHFNRTLLELTRTMLIEKQLLAFLWDEAVAHAIYLL